MKLIKDLGYLFPTETSKQKSRYGLYKCFCGDEFRTQINKVKIKHTQSCGCLKTTHGLSKHRLFKTWTGMMNRCYEPKTPHYNHYGERGITVCSRWHNIENFINDMYPSHIEGLTLDRINPNGNYEKENCRWANQTTQTRNTICIPSHNTSGMVGVYFNKTCKKWVANICINNKTKYIGIFHTIEEARNARNNFILSNNLEHTLR